MPERIPIDPESLDATRPVDLDACGQCHGTGDLPRWIEDGFDAVDCWACRGRGVLGPGLGFLHPHLDGAA